ncbi:AAA family ATPase, partial [Bacteroides fragilis]
MAVPSIKKFIIRGLFGIKDVELSFEKQVQIFIGENGLGKTTVLNSLYYV